MRRPPRSRHPGRRSTPVVVRDLRRVDPDTGGPGPCGLGGPKPLTPAGRDTDHGGTPPPADPPAGPPPGAGRRDELRERVADLQRLKAEYDNYRKRVRRDRIAVREIAVANVLAGLLPVLDAVAAARESGEVVAGFEAVVETLQAQLAALGLRSFGREGEPFDPTVHRAVTLSHSTAVDRPTCVRVLRPGYRVGDQLLRPAEVMVAEPPA
ncbi:nucleotide exchange factor GrpE [Allostreptomyces psammosilenae]|uniref:Protein GrpE n=1 Tax=Allostreptomyces psammosilenae TaxID=1892865 RepID=A0A853A193_9ACTN|nr:nucleotide exchange factor GrpE [Allostreptomyces psammosilenae]NYI04282.1 molecular chaperone GrpE [Allostreptomyces psammosilenae]